MGVQFVKIADDWVSPSEVAAVERRPGGGARVHLKSGASLAYSERVTPDAVIQKMFEAEAAAKQGDENVDA